MSHDDLFAALSRFHREVMLPDLDSRIETLRSENASLHREVLSHFDRLQDRLRTNTMKIVVSMRDFQGTSPL